MNTKWFSRIGWFYLPTSMAGGVLCLLGVIFCLTVFTGVDRHSHSVSDTLYGVFPFVAMVLLTLLFPIFTAGLMLASRTIDQGGDPQFKQLFAGFRHRLGALLTIGAVYLVANVLITLAVFALLGVDPSAIDVNATPMITTPMHRREPCGSVHHRVDGDGPDDHRARPATAVTSSTRSSTSNGLRETACAPTTSGP